MDTVNLAADKFTDGMGARMTEFTINPAKGTAEMRRVSIACCSSCSNGLRSFDMPKHACFATHISAANTGQVRHSMQPPSCAATHRHM
jgi:hypothetical protein